MEKRRHAKLSPIAKLISQLSRGFALRAGDLVIDNSIRNRLSV
ncbi:hypothetical protein ACNKHW_23900 [Shigella flexneri]